MRHGNRVVPGLGSEEVWGPVHAHNAAPTSVPIMHCAVPYLRMQSSVTSQTSCLSPRIKGLHPRVMEAAGRRVAGITDCVWGLGGSFVHSLTCSQSLLSRSHHLLSASCAPDTLIPQTLRRTRGCRVQGFQIAHLRPRTCCSSLACFRGGSEDLWSEWGSWQPEVRVGGVLKTSWLEVGGSWGVWAQERGPEDLESV